MSKKPKTFTLSEPIVSEGGEITEVVIPKPKVKDLKRMDEALRDVEDQLDQGIIMVSTFTGLSVDVVEEMDAEDFTKISEVIADFFPRAKEPESGEAS